MQRTAGDPLLHLVDTALEQTTLSGICELLQSITRSLQAYGCVLWEAAPGSDLEANPQVGFLFAVAQWFTDGRGPAFGGLSLGSVTGRAVIEGRPQRVSVVTDEMHQQRIFLDSAGVQAFCSLPLTFTHGARGALNLYRKDPRPFTGAELDLAQQLADLLPRLYRTVRSEIAYLLLGQVGEILREADLSASGVSPSNSETEVVIQRVCDLVARSFDCVETSIHLEDRLEEPGVYRLVATSWPRSEDLPFPRLSYRLGERGITPWMLAHKEPVLIPDLARFERHQTLILQRYPGLTWNDPLNILTTIRRLRDTGPEGELQPVSFMGTPMLVGGEAIGTIRCCGMRRPPWYFGEREVGLVTLVASQVGHYWNNWLSRRETERENQSWRLLVAGIKKLNRSVQGEITQEAPIDEHRVFQAGLEVLRLALPGADGLDVRLFDAGTRELYFLETSGSVWSQGSEEEIRQRSSQRFPVDAGAPGSPGASAFRRGVVVSLADVPSHPLYSTVFPGVRRMIIAPVRSGTETLGVLDILSTAERAFPREAESIAELVGQQLGLYHTLAATIQKYVAADSELRHHLQTQSQTYDDLRHQLKTPVFQAHAIARSALVGKSTPKKLRASLLALRGLLWKAERVTRAVGLFADLASGRPIEPKLSRLEYPRFVRGLEWAAADIEKMLGEARRIKFNVDRVSFHVLHDHEVRVDYDLLEHAISNLLDNAGKYSYSDTTVRVYGGLTGAGRFHISVVNKGLRLQKKEVPLCIQRGWRSEDAKAVTGEGSGIGLWIADYIMRAHEGELLIVPTTPEGSTEVKLLLSVVRSRSY